MFIDGTFCLLRLQAITFVPVSVRNVTFSVICCHLQAGRNVYIFPVAMLLYNQQNEDLKSCQLFHDVLSDIHISDFRTTTEGCLQCLQFLGNKHYTHLSQMERCSSPGFTSLTRTLICSVSPEVL
jgi:hypothetical protein